MEERFTSFELSKKLAEAGCKLESECSWRIYSFDNKEPQIELWDKKDGCIVRINSTSLKLVPAFDILNDICVRYADKFFHSEAVCWKCGKSYDDWIEIGYNYCEACRRCEHNKKGWEFISKQILELMQQNKKQEAEDCIWNSTLFNINNQKR